MDKVANQLAASAPRFARDALEALSAGDAVGFALHAATSLEHLLKSYLARKHPALIVDARSVDSLLHACDQAQATKSPRDQVRTITAKESLARATRFLASLASHRERLEELFAVRNGVVHLADTSAVQPFVLSFLKASETVREALGIAREAYWGQYDSLAEATLREHVEAAELKVAAAVSAAKVTYADRFGALDDGTLRSAVIAALEPRTFDVHTEHPVQCPVCGSTAVATGTAEPEWQYEQIADDDFDVTFEATFLADALSCKICGLQLSSPDEVYAAGVPTAWAIPDADPTDFIEEPDVDFSDYPYR